MTGLVLTMLLATATLSPSRVVAGLTDGEWARIAIPPVPPPMVPARTSFVLVLDTTRDRMIAFGGDPGPMQDTWFLPLAPGSVWQPLTVPGVKPSGRYGHAAIYDPLGDRVVLFGGTGPGLLNDVWVLELSGAPHWTLLSPAGAPPTGRQDVAAVFDAALNRMVIFGGYRVGGIFTNEVWALSLDATPTWTPISPAGPAPTGRGTMQSALDVARNRLLVFGGWNGTVLGDTWALDLSAGGSWTSIATVHAPAARREGAAVHDASGDRMIVFGGWDGSRYQDSWELPLAGTPDWVPLSTTGTPPSPRSGSRAVYDPLRDRMLVFAGYDFRYRADTRALSLDGSANWSLIQDDAILGGLTPRRDVSAVYDPATRAMLIFGGTNVSIDFNETWKLDLSAIDPQWQRVEEGNTRPNPRHGHRAVWDPARNRMLVVGGYAGDYVNDVWELEMGTTPAWHEVHTEGVPPQGRMLFGLALDPVHDRLIMVGGHSGFPPGYSPTYWNDVWELPLSGPSALTWSPLVVSGTPPSERWIYSMRYDPPRDRMVMFGGVSSAGRTNEVWTLELSGTPRWVYMNPAMPPPSNRSDHVMVYDQYNDRMVMFGGFDGAFRNDAWALEMNGSPQWNLLNPIGGPPSPRDIIDGIYDPVAGRMIVFGGWDGTRTLNETWTLAWGTPPTPTEASLIESHVESDRVRLAWYVRDAVGVHAAVERRAQGANWAFMGAPALDGGEILRFEDTDITPGTRYTYRLRLNANGEETLTAETEIEVPTGYTLALAGAQPNPTDGGPLNVSFALARASDGRLELLDLAGRRVASRDLRGLSPGQHRLVFSEAARAEPGVYLLRLVTSERTLTAKALITR